ncbi:MAG: hypothetical protein OEL76_09495, partial [Siculibacillus sp.]|nr:hypothetical protein [Siculibacillus sp.]
MASTISVAVVCLAAPAAWAQPAAMQPGEAFLTRFSGVTAGAPGPMIDPAGKVGSIVDIRSPGRPPQGEHWADEPQRRPVTAAEVGQVFGVVLDGASPPNIYLSATSAYGLHTVQGGRWMPGMWGPGGGPGTIWRIDPASGRAQPFADVKLDGRPNSGAALGNMAFDRTTSTIYVSDMETGMIHRIDATSGADLGRFDHGTAGRTAFVDAETGQPANLPAIAFDPATRAKVSDCTAGAFDATPACWNLAATGRRIWGVGVRAEPGSTSRRLYYAVWSGPDGGPAAANAAEADKRSAVWSVGLAADGGFVPGDVRREFVLPDFFAEAKDVARAGYSRPVADITFDECASTPVMLVAERGGHRNLGLGTPEAFAFPHEARTLRYEMDQAGNWQPVGRYDVGFYDRAKDGVPYLRAGAAGGAAFGYGYKADWSTIDRNAPGQFVWVTGDALCSPDGPCRAPAGAEGVAQPASAQEAGADPSEVHGLQGLPEGAADALAPPGAFAAYPQNGEPYPASGPEQSYMIDADLNLDTAGNGIVEEFTRNDATRIGDVAIHAICNPPRAPKAAELLPVIARPKIGVVTVVEGHDPRLTHATIASHGATSSHFRIGSHNPWASHDRVRSHNRWRSHDVVASRPLHRPIGSLHRPIGSVHRPIGSVHFPRGSIHRPVGSIHRPVGSIHRPIGSVHLPRGSVHRPVGSLHRPVGSIHLPRGSVHRPVGSVHVPRGSIHNRLMSPHRPIGSVHRPPGSIHRPPGSVHLPPGSVHRPVGSVHRPVGSVHRPVGSVHRPVGSVHRPVGSVHRPPGSLIRPLRRPPGSVVQP